MLDIRTLTPLTETEEKTCEHLTARLLKEGYIYRDACQNDKTDYYNIIREPMQEYIQSILYHCGKDLTIRKNYGVAYITQREGFESYVDQKCDKNQTMIILRLYQAFNMQQSKVSLTSQTIIKLEELQSLLKNADKREIKTQKLIEYLLDLQKYNLIKIDSPSKKAIDGETNIFVYPSLACFMQEANLEYINEMIEKLHQDSTREEN